MVYIQVYVSKGLTKKECYCTPELFWWKFQYFKKQRPVKSFHLPFLPCPSQSKYHPHAPCAGASAWLACGHLLPSKHPEPRTDVGVGWVWKCCPRLQPSHKSRIRNPFPEGVNSPIPFVVLHRLWAINQSSCNLLGSMKQEFLPIILCKHKKQTNKK